MAKHTFRNYWGWSTLSEWGGGDRIPDAVRLPDDVVVPLDWDTYNACSADYFEYHPRSRAKYTPMNESETVRLIRETGGDNPAGRQGQRWALMGVIAPRGSMFLYGGRCDGCGMTIEYSEDPDAAPLCNACQEWQEEQERMIEEQRRIMAEEERKQDEEQEAWLREQGHIR